MVTICMTFVPSVSPTPASVKDIYERSNPELSGLKKFCVDYYIFQQSTTGNRISIPYRTALPAANNSNVIKNEIAHDSQTDAVHCLHQVLPLKNYSPAFFRDVTKTINDIHTELSTKLKRVTPYDRVRKEYNDVQVDFSNLGLWLGDGDEGRQKYRYHQHSKDELCLSRIP